jgi:BirA family transcriptional regulator, biotin operon repressor / biotin---[acetyl-CoA-carboxylase] ligase
MRTIHRFATVDSTMTKAAELAAGGAESGTVVVADEQTSGQGRLGRTWHSEPGAGLYLTQILRPKLCADSLPIVTLALGLATAEAMASTAGVNCDLRWPNDVLIGSRKCAGILAQLQDDVLLAGIGINVNHTTFPAEIAHLATSLRIATGRGQSIEQLLNALLDSIDSHLDTLFRDGKDPVLRAFTVASSYVRGRRVIVEQGSAELRGTTDGLDPQGFLRLRQDNGTRKLILAGGVRPECS